MSKTDTQRKLTALYVLALNYGKEFPQELAKLWLTLLEPYSVEQVEKGVSRVVNEYEYKTLPPFAVLRKAIDKRSGILPPEQTLDIQAEAEWNALLNAISTRGRYNPPMLHHTTAYVLRGMGGWDAACSWETERLELRHKRFIETWKLVHGKTDTMALGARGLEALPQQSEQPEEFSSAGAILGKMLSITGKDMPGPGKRPGSGENGPALF